MTTVIQGRGCRPAAQNPSANFASPDIINGPVHAGRDALYGEWLFEAVCGALRARP
jgi:hypothetical protein